MSLAAILLTAILLTAACLFGVSSPLQASVAGFLLTAGGDPVPAAGAGGKDRTSLDLAATYDVGATIAWASGRITVHSAMHVRNTSGGPIEHLELNALPARIGGMHLDGVTVDGAASAARIRGQTIIVPLGFTLARGAETDVVVDYRARFRDATGGHLFLWSRANGILSAYRWIPWISRRTAYEVAWHGDPFVTPISPRVRVTITADVPLRYATSGRVVAHHGRTWTWLAQQVRDFDFTAARDYHVLTGRSVDGDTTIQVFTRTLDARLILRWARRAMADYERRIGPYPYPTLTYGESSGGIGMESPGHIWLPYRFSTAKLPFLVGHETAHQWFYGVVGNDQTTDGFADEAMAELLDRTLFGSYRASRCATNRLDLTLYQYASSCYYETIYVQGTNFLASIRDRMGAARFWRTIRAYWRAQRWQLSSDRTLLDALHAAAGDWVLPMFRARFPSLYQ